MKYELNKWNKSNYEIIITVAKSDLDTYKTSVLKKFAKDFDAPWFRKWQAPISMVEQKMDPMYLQMWIYEEVVHSWLDKILEENKDIHFIWNIYDVNENSWEKDFSISFKLDVYPEVEIKNKNWESVKINEINSEVSDEEFNQTIDNLKRQYAKYEDTSTMTWETVSKIKFDFLDEDWNVLDSWTAFVWKEDISENKIFEKLIWKTKEDNIILKYEHDKFPHIIHYHKDDKVPSKISISLIDIREVVLPELDDKWVQELFKWEVKSYDELKEKVIDTIKEQKYSKLLVESIEWYITAVSESISVTIPRTLIEKEEESRMSALEQRFWWKEWMKKYFEKMSDEEKNNIKSEINQASESSLLKFFVFRHITEALWIDKDVDWNTPLDVEKKVYEKLVWPSNKTKSTKKSTEKTSEKKTTKSKTK